MQAPYAASVRNASDIEIPPQDRVVIVLTDIQPAFCDADHTSPMDVGFCPLRLTSRSLGELIATESGKTDRKGSAGYTLLATVEQRRLRNRVE